MTSSVMTFDTFSRHLRTALKIPPDKALEEETLLTEDLHLDSLELFELIIVLEEAGSTLDVMVLASVDTLGELHFAYIRGLGLGPPT